MKKTKEKNKSVQKWHLVNAKDKILGRLATSVANLLRGKDKPLFKPWADVGDYVVVINASQIKVSGKKIEQKTYYRHSGYPGGLKKETLKEVLKEKPEEAIRRAISGMLPNNKLKKLWLKKLYIYGGEEHPHKEKLEKVDA